MGFFLAIPLAYEAALFIGGAIAVALATPQGQDALGEAADATGDLIGGAIDGAGNLIDSVTSSSADPQTRPQALPLPGTETATQSCSPCPPLIAHIDNLINAARPPFTRSGTKGLKQRFCAQKHGRISGGSRWTGEVQAITSQQNGVRATYNKAVTCGCPMTPEMHRDVQIYGQMPSPPNLGHRPGFEEYCYGMALSRREG